MESLIMKVLEFFAIAILVLLSLGAGLYFSGYFSVKGFCRPYPEEEKIWSDDLEADYEHEEEMSKGRTGYFNIFVPTFFFRHL